MNVIQAIENITTVLELSQKTRDRDARRIARLERQIMGLVLSSACMLALIIMLATLTLG